MSFVLCVRDSVEAQEAKVQADTAAERTASRQAAERHAQLQRELNSKNDNLSQAETERDRLSIEVQQLRQVISDSDIYKTQHDQHKERLERELVTIKGRLAASENDNRALLNKVQQKNLEVARSSSRAIRHTKIAHDTAASRESQTWRRQ